MKAIIKKKRFMNYRQRMGRSRWIGLVVYDENGRRSPAWIRIRPWWNHV